MRQLILLVILIICSLEQGRGQLTVNVNARSNIFSAGRDSVSAPGGGGGGILPDELLLVDDIGWINFKNVTGQLSFIGNRYDSADGSREFGTNITGINGISGAYHKDYLMMLVGVFLDDCTPSGEWSGSNELYDNQIENRPELNRIFYIGDGLTGRGTGSLQNFYVPEGATRLFLGFADALAFRGLPGWYDDNNGAINVTIGMYSNKGLLLGGQPLTDKFNAINELYTDINSALRLKSDTSRYFILEKVRSECANDFDCLYRLYVGLSNMFEGNSNLTISFFINQELIRLCKREKYYDKFTQRYLEQLRYLSILRKEDSTFFKSFIDANSLADSTVVMLSNLVSKGLIMEAERVVRDITQKDMESEKQMADSKKEVFFLLALFSFLSLGLMTIGFAYQQKVKKKLALQNEKISEQATRLKNIDETKSRSFANIGHELRTPLTLAHGPLNTTINPTLDLSKIEAGKMMLKEEAAQVYRLSRRIVSGFESHAQANGLQLNFEYLGEEQLTLALDREKVETVLNNLLSNAIKFSNKKGTVTVTIKDREKDILFIVKDTGRGISKTDLPYIFNRYFQTEVLDAPTEGGTGIGLAFTKELVELMEGRIWVESELGLGTTFFIELPRKEVLGVIDASDQIHVQDDFKRSEKTRPLETLQKESVNQVFDQTILLVKDNSNLQDYIYFILASQFNIIVAGNGQEALDYLNSSYDNPSILRPDLIVSDVMMPFMDGFQFVAKLKVDAKFNQIPVIMLTARADVRDKLKALRIGVDDYLLKPIHEDELKVRIDKLLTNYGSRSSSVLEGKKAQAPLSEFSKEDMEWLAMFEDYISVHYTKQILNVSRIAHDMAMSESSLLRKLKQLTGLSPARYLQEVRLEKARSYLNTRTFNSVSKVALEVGYSDPKTFSRNFKSRYGKSPSEYLRQLAVD